MPVTVVSSDNHAGIIPGSNPTNRRFWNDPYVEPKQQHRFGIVMPVYMSYGTNQHDTTECAQWFLDNQGKTGAVLSGGAKALTAKGRGSKGGLYCRVSEYVGYSFTPPTLGFTPGLHEDKTAGQDVLNEGNNTYQVGDVNIELVITLRDDLHWSLNFLFALTALDGVGDIPTTANCALFPSILFKENFTGNTLVVKEYSARQKPPGPPSKNPARVNTSATAAEYYGLAPARLIGEHKMKSPLIKSVAFDPFTYGGTELIKVKLVVGWGKGKEDMPESEEELAGMKRFYSYDAKTSRYQRSYFTWQDDTEDGKEKVPNFNKAKKEALVKYPNWAGGDTFQAARKAEEIKRERTRESYIARFNRANLIKTRIREGDPTKINELVSKSIQTLLDEKAAAEQEAARIALEDRLHREMISADALSFEDQADAEAEAALERLNARGQDDAGMRRWRAGEEREQFRLDQEAALDTINSEYDQRLRLQQENERLDAIGSDYDALREQQLISEDVDWRLRRDSQEMARQQRIRDMQDRIAAQGGNAQDVLARRIARLSGNQSSSGTNVSNFGQED